MSHLSLLPTVMREVDLLVTALEALSLHPERGGQVPGFGGEVHPVDVWITLGDGLAMGWRYQPDGTLSLVADLQKLSGASALPRLLASISHCYAAHLALREISTQLEGAVVELVG